MELHLVQADNYGRRYLRPAQLMNQFSLGRGTVWDFIKEMEQLPRFQRDIVRPSARVTLVRESAFDDFLRQRQKRRLTAAKK